MIWLSNVLVLLGTGMGAKATSESIVSKSCIGGVPPSATETDSEADL